MEEERRLCYVGITRAKKQVYLVRAFRRNLMGRSLVSQPSRFLQDIPARLMASAGWWQEEETRIADAVYSWNRPSTPTPRLTTAEFKAGDHVHHAQFGNGIVVSTKAAKDDTEVTVAFNSGVKKLLLSFANLEKTE
jgi:DNA helicase-2/ATP-dependent DNA helicase PcrA